MADSRTLELILRLKDEASTALSGVGKKLDNFQQSLEPAADASRKFALGLGAVGVAAGGLGVMALKAAADMEQTQIAFTTMLGSAEKANEFTKQLIEFAKRTPFELKGLETASKQLLAYGFAQEDVLPNLKALGDIASGVGMDKLPNLILAFGQVKAATKLTGMELRQFTEAGVPLLEMLAKQMKKPVSAIQEMVSEGQIGFPEVEKALKSLTSEGGKFENLMDKQSKSLGGMVSNLRDAWDAFLRGEGQKLIEWAKQFVAVAIEIVQNHLPKWIDKTEEIIKWLGEHKNVLYLLAGVITALLVPAILSIATSLAIAIKALTIGNPWGLTIGAIVALALIIYEHWDKIKQTTIDTWNAVVGFVKKVVDDILFYIEDTYWLIEWKIRTAWETIKTETIRILTEIITAIKNWVSEHEIATGAIVGALSAVVALGFVRLVQYIYSQVIPALVQFVVTVSVQAYNAIKNFALTLFTETIPALVKFVWTVLTETIPALVKLALELTINAVKALVAFAASVWTSAISAIVAFATTIWTTVLPAIAAFTTALLTNPIFALIALGVAIGALVALTIKHWDTVKTVTTKVWTAIKDFFVSIWDEIKAIFQSAIDWITDKINGLLSIIDKVKGAASSIGNSIGSAVGGVGKAIGVNDAIISPNGNIITTHPDDYLIATKNPGALAGGGIVINVYGDVSGQELVAKVQEGIMNTLRLNSRLPV